MPAITSYLIAVIAVTLYATMPAITKKALVSDVPPFAFMAITMSMLALFAITATFIQEKGFSFGSISPAAWRWMVCLSVVNFTGFALFLLAVKVIPVAEYQLIAMAAPLIGGVLAWFILKEPFQVLYSWLSGCL